MFWSRRTRRRIVQKFDRLLLETVFLPGLDTKEWPNTVNVIRNVFGVQQVSSPRRSRHAEHSLPLRSTLRAINATLGQLYLDKPEVMLDVRVYQVNDSRQEDLGRCISAAAERLQCDFAADQHHQQQSKHDYGIDCRRTGESGRSGRNCGAADWAGSGEWNSVLNQPFALFGNGLTLSGLSFGGTTVNASLNISDTREIDHVQLRAGDLEKQTVLIGVALSHRHAELFRRNPNAYGQPTWRVCWRAPAQRLPPPRIPLPWRLQCSIRIWA